MPSGLSLAVVVPFGEGVAAELEEARLRVVSERRTEPTQEQYDQLLNAIIEATNQGMKALDDAEGEPRDLSIGIKGGDTWDPYDFEVSVRAYAPVPIVPPSPAQARAERQALRNYQAEMDRPRETVAADRETREREAQADEREAKAEEEQARRQRQQARAERERQERSK